MKIIVIRKKIINKKEETISTPLNTHYIHDVLDLVDEIESGVKDNWDISIIGDFTTEGRKDGHEKDKKK